jgi:hypothetical protein
MEGAWTLDRVEVPSPHTPRIARIERDAAPLLRAAHLMGAAGDVALAVRHQYGESELIPACRQAQALLALAAQLVIQSTAADISCAATTANAGLTLAECAPSITGLRRMHSQFDSATTSPNAGVAQPGLRDLRASIIAWTTAASRALSPEATATAAALVRVCGTQQRLVATTAAIVDDLAVARSRRRNPADADQPPRAQDIREAKARMQRASNTWRRPRDLWMRLRMPGRFDADLAQAAADVHSAIDRLNRLTGRTEVFDTVLVARAALDANSQVACAAARFTVTQLAHGFILGRADILEPRPDRALSRAQHAWIPVALDERAAVDLDNANQRVMRAGAAALDAYHLDRADPARSAAPEILRALGVGHDLGSSLFRPSPR